MTFNLPHRRGSTYAIVGALFYLTILATPGCDGTPPTGSSGLAQKATAPAEPPSASQAMALLYPGSTGQGRKLSLLGTGELPGQTPQRRVVFITTDAMDPTPVAGLDVGAVVFVLDGDHWRAELVQPHIGIVAEERMTEDPLVIRRIDIGPSSVAFLVPDGSSNQGITVEGAHVFGYEKGRFADVGFIEVGEENGGNCADDDEGKALGRAPCWEYTGDIMAQPGARPDHHDLSVKRHGTRLVNGVIVPAKDIRCTFDGKRYVCPES
jgi:hypothetical protein